MKNMRVIMLLPMFPPAMGGMEQQAYLLSKELTAKGVDVSVITSGIKGTPFVSRSNGLKIYRSPYFYKDIEYCIINKQKYLKLFNSFLYFIFVLPMLILLKLKHGQYTIHCHGQGISLFCAIIMKKIFSAKVVVKIPTQFNESFFKTYLLRLKNSRMTRLDLWLTKKSDAVILFDSKSEYYIRKLGIFAKIHLAFNGVDVNYFVSQKGSITSRMERLSSKCPILLYVGRLSEEKGIFILIDAYKKVVKFYPDSKLMIIGDGPDHIRLKMYIDKLKISNNCILMGKQNNLVTYYNNADIFILPSLREGIPNVILESMACGLPIISTNVGMISEILTDGKEGLLIKAGVVAELEQSIIKVLSDTKLALMLGKNARLKVEKYYSIIEIAESYKNFYENMSN